MKSLSWFVNHPLALMDIGIKIFIISVAVFVMLMNNQYQKHAKAKREESVSASEAAYKILQTQYNELRTRYDIAVEHCNKLNTNMICRDRIAAHIAKTTGILDVTDQMIYDWLDECLSEKK